MSLPQSNEKHVFDTITTNTGDLITQSQSRLEIGCLCTAGTQSGFSKLFFDVASDPVNFPVVWDLKLNPSDIFKKKDMKRADAYYEKGIWTGSLKAGGNFLGMSTVKSRYVCIGNIVTVWG